MRIDSSNALGWWAMVLLYLVLSLNVIAKDKDPNIIVQGTVFLIDKDSSIIMVDTRAGVRRLWYTAWTRSSDTGAATKAKKAL